MDSHTFSQLLNLHDLAMPSLPMQHSVAEVLSGGNPAKQTCVAAISQKLPVSQRPQEVLCSHVPALLSFLFSRLARKLNPPLDMMGASKNFGG